MCEFPNQLASARREKLDKYMKGEKKFEYIPVWHIPTFPNSLTCNYGIAAKVAEMHKPDSVNTLSQPTHSHCVSVLFPISSSTAPLTCKHVPQMHVWHRYCVLRIEFMQNLGLGVMLWGLARWCRLCTRMEHPTWLRIWVSGCFTLVHTCLDYSLVVEFLW